MPGTAPGLGWGIRKEVFVVIQFLTIFIGESDGSEVLKVLQSVKLQQRYIIEQLEEQQAELEHNLDVIRQHHVTHDADYPHITPGIPEEASRLPCPYNDLKSVVLNEFELLDKRYETHLDYLDVKYAEAIQ